jgi:hypothetical protein
VLFALFLSRHLWLDRMPSAGIPINVPYMLMMFVFYSAPFHGRLIVRLNLRRKCDGSCGAGKFPGDEILNAHIGPEFNGKGAFGSPC